MGGVLLLLAGACGDPAPGQSESDVTETVPDESCPCPAGFEYSPNGEGLEYCIAEPERPPGARAYCGQFEEGYFGYYWSLSDAPDYACPEGARRTDNGDDLAFCLWEDLDVPEGAEAYCSYIDEGYFGYSWDACGESFRYEATEDGFICVLDALEPPETAAPYCTYVTAGYLGFYWSLMDEPDYLCPEDAFQVDNGAGIGFCLWAGFETPEDAFSICEADAGVLGYAWTEPDSCR
jgi:hypothetical protein